MIDFFSFDTLITPYIIGIIYIIGAVIAPIVILYYFKKYKLKISNIKYRLYILIVSIVIEIFWRIFCEFFIVYFKIFLALSPLQD
ncbi:DUF4282 domain-containing protein [Sulfurimonas sp. CS5]|jgi:hypothetical protein|uniref:DUF4282 domain-containing protein n=1 Tax=Sulfurimonas sp. CS5 TaxID=3391145 RepID=UPI0039EBF359